MVGYAKRAAEEICEQNLHKIHQHLEKKQKINNYEFKKEGNKKMFDHSVEVLNSIDSALESMEKGKIEETKDYLEKGKELVLQRIKVVKLADREDWLTAKLYSRDILAEDSDDEKQLAKAIKQAKAQREKTKNKSSRSYNNSSYIFSSRRTDLAARRPSERKSSDLCWGCGKSGHFLSTCYKMKNYERKK